MNSEIEIFGVKSEQKIPYYEDNTRISNSSLGWFLTSPKLYRDILDGNVKLKPTSAMENGTMVHMYILQPDEFKSTYRILDFTIPTSAQQKQFCVDYINSKATTVILKAVEAFKANYSTTGKSEEDNAKKGLEMALKLKPYIKWLRSKDGDKKVISWSDLNTLKITKENVLLHKKAKELLFNSANSEEVVTYNEFHVNWSWMTEKTSEQVRALECKSLIDRLIVDHKNKKITMVDIKTTVSVKDFKKSFSEYDYGRQMAFYWFAIRYQLEVIEELDLTGYEHETYIVALQNNGTAECRVFRVSDDTIETKAEEIKQILSDIDWHIKNNLWDYTRSYYERDGVENLLL